MYGSSGWLVLNVSTSTLPFQQRKWTMACGGRRVPWLWWQMRRRRGQGKGNPRTSVVTRQLQRPVRHIEALKLKTSAHVRVHKLTHMHTLVRQRKHGLTRTLSAMAGWGLCLSCQHIRQRACLHKARGRGQSLAVGDGSRALLSRHQWTLSLCVQITQGGYSVNGWGGTCVWMNVRRLLVATTSVNSSAYWGTK